MGKENWLGKNRDIIGTKSIVKQICGKSLLLQVIGTPFTVYAVYEL